MDADVRERFERIESNMLQFSEGMKDFRNEFSREMRDINTRLNDVMVNMKEFAVGMKKLEEAQGRTNDVLHTLLDALFTQRGNGHSKQQLPE